MIFVSHSLPVNVAGQPVVTRSMLWDGLVRKAGNALPFVPIMSRCEVTTRYGDDCFDREIEIRGERFTERVTLEAPHRVVFTRLSGPVLGTIANEIEGDGNGENSDDFALRFSFALVVADVPGGTSVEKETADRMTDDYLAAVTATLEAVRRIARGDTPGTA